MLAPVRERLQRWFAWLFRWTASAKAVPAIKQTAWQRAKVDTSSFAAGRPILFGALAAAGVAVVGILAAVWTSGEPVLVQVVCGVVGAVVGFLLIALVIAIICWLRAFPKQRNEARKEVERLTGEPEPDAQLFKDFDAFLIAARAKEPQEIRTSANIFEKEGFQQIVRVQNDYRSSLQEWWRETIGEYHERFRARVLLALKDTNEADTASDPKSFRDLERIDLELNYLDYKSGPGP